MAPALAQIEGLTLKPIVKAVREGDEEKVRSALLKGESPNQIDTSGQPLLMVAVVAGHIAVVETLLKGGAIPDTLDKEGYTSMIRAAERGDVDLVEILLAKNAKVDKQTRQGATALSIAARRGYAEAELNGRLLDKGYSTEAAALALARCRDLGYLDDAYFAQQRALALMRNGRAVGRRVGGQVEHGSLRTVGRWDERTTSPVLGGPE